MLYDMMVLIILKNHGKNLFVKEFKMKKVYLLLLSLLICIFLLSVVSAQETTPEPKGEMIGNVFYPKDSSQQKLTTILVEDFENCDTWTALMPSNQGVARAKKVLGAAKSVKEGGGNTTYCLGIKEWGYRRGFNWTEIKPPDPIQITGKLKGLSIWAVGRNYRHHLEIWVKNYQGIEYPIDMGSLNYRGWKQLEKRIPMFIPYYTKYVPQYKPIWITRFVIRHDPDERHGNFYVYLDDLRAIVDSYEDTFDGDDMINEMGMERWEEVTSGAGAAEKQEPPKATPTE